MAKVDIWNQTNAELKATLDSGILKPCCTTIRFYSPSFTYYKSKHFCNTTQEFPSISVTGKSCSLNCLHCGGKVLETMHPATTPTQLLALAKHLKSIGAKGVLVSGGCTPDGSVPLDNFIPTLGQLKHDLGLTVFVHTGVVNAETAFDLKKADIDAVLLDVLGSDQTIKEVLNLKVAVADYAQSLHELTEANLNVVPHVIVGLHHGMLSGERQALRIIEQNAKPKALVIIAFMPIHGTQMASALPPEPLDIARVAAAARITFPATPITLGCMRPKGKIRAETDLYAIKAGVDAIAFPSDQAVEYAKTRGWSISFSSYCCAEVYLDSKV